MKHTEYFTRRVLQERPFIRLDWCERTVREPLAIEVQPDGRIRHWRFIPNWETPPRNNAFRWGDAPQRVPRPLLQARRLSLAVAT